MKNTKDIVYAALLIALGVLIPMVMPKFDTGIASYTLGSHVPVMTAMFISPMTTILVAIGTAISYLMTSTPIVATRALSHIVFALLGSFMIQKNRNIIKTAKSETMFNITIGLIHIAAECLVVTVFLFSGAADLKTIFTTVVIAVGLGGFAHSFVDFFITAKITKALKLIK